MTTEQAIEPDFITANHGSLLSIIAISDRAKEGLDAGDLIAYEDWQRLDDSIMVDYHMGIDLFHHLIGDGFVLQDEATGQIARQSEND